MKRPSPLDAARDFRVNEMFFSTTDRKGVIRSGNDVFVRISGYERTELVGSPHNIIRHPAMPRAVFRLIWDHLLAGAPVAGFVKNLAKDGRYYWVVAYLTPIEGGFLSIRFKPTSALLPAVEAIYREMIAGENDHEARGGDRKEGMRAAEQRLLAALRRHGFDNYDLFMRAMLHDELKSRDAQLSAQRLRLFPETLPAGAADEALRASLVAIHTSSRQAYAQIDTLYAQLDEFAVLNEKLRDKSAFILGLTKDFRFIAFNAALRAARLGEEGRSLGVIAEYLGGASESTTRTVAELTNQIGAILGKLRTVTFNLAAARLQIEMVMSFCAELALGRADDRGVAAATADRCRMIEDLQRAFASTIDLGVKALLELEEELDGLAAHAEEMRRKALTLQVAQVGGLVEAQRLRDDDSFTVMFTDLRQGVEGTKKELAELDEIGGRLSALAKETPAIAAKIAQAVGEMDREVRDLAAAAAHSVTHAKPDAASGGSVTHAKPPVSVPKASSVERELVSVA